MCEYIHIYKHLNFLSLNTHMHNTITYDVNICLCENHIQTLFYLMNLKMCNWQEFFLVSTIWYKQQECLSLKFL